ncbi:MAG: alpha-hydroxy acid oxidase [Burkholderiaceae bacterium]
MLSLDDFEAAARRQLPRPIFAYVSGGCETDRSREDNRNAFADYDWVTRVFTDSSRRTLATTLMGTRYAAPFGIAPMGISALSAYRGDLIQTRAAAAARIPAIMSGSSLIPMEEVRAANPGAWFQAYLPGEPDRILALVDRVERAGFETLVITADVPVSGNRENNVRARFSTPLRPSLRLAWDGITHPRWLFGTALRTLMNHGMPHFENTARGRGAPMLSSQALREFGARDHLDWTHLALIRERWPHKLVVKGILSPEDALRARDTGADGIIVSNHGGRQLDGSIAPLRALPAVVEALGPDYPVMIDSGFRRGGDVLMALALGAKFVFVGRPFNYAGAVGGEAGIAHAIGILATEMARNMALLGVLQPSDLGSHHLRRRGR